MKKYIFIVFGVILAAFLVLLSYYFFSRAKLTQINTTTSSQGGITFETASDYGDIKLGIKNEQKLFEWLNEKGILNIYQQDGVRGLDENQVYHPNKIKILLTKEPQSFFKLMSKVEGFTTEARSYGSDYSEPDNVYTLKLYINDKILALGESGNIKTSNLVNYYIIDGLYAISSINKSSSEIIDSFSEIEIDLGKKSFDAFEIIKSTSANFFKKIGSTFVKTANAQTCTGLPRGCNTFISWIECPLGGSYDGQCFGGTCNITTCTDGSNTAACRCMNVCTETYFKPCKVVAGLCRADPCGGLSCSPPPESAPNCYWTGGNTPTPTPSGGGCTCSGWTNQGCGLGPCAADERYETRTCNPGGCAGTGQCLFDATCNPPSCTVDGFVPNPVNIPVGGTQTVTVNVTPVNGTIDRVDFVMDNPAIATLAPASDNTVPYQTVVTGVTPGDTEVRATVIMNGVAACGGANPVDPVTVTNPLAWWQVINGDVITNGDVISPIPPTCSLPLCEPVFSVALLGGYPGVPTFTGTYDFQAGAGLGTASTTNWLARAGYSAAQSYDFNYFNRLVPGDTVRNNIADSLITPNYLKNQGAPSPDGYKWYFRSGDLIMEGEPTLMTDKVVLFVDGNLNIDGIIDLTNGRGFFMAIVSGNITVNSGVWHPNVNSPELTGIFVANGNFISETDTNTLYIRGMVSAYNQVQLDKDLADNSQTPAEKFEYAPELIFKMPQSFNLKRTRWKEVSP